MATMAIIRNILHIALIYTLCKINKKSVIGKKILNSDTPLASFFVNSVYKLIFINMIIRMFPIIIRFIDLPALRITIFGRAQDPPLRLRGR